MEDGVLVIPELSLSARFDRTISGEYLVLSMPGQQAVLQYQLEMIRQNPHPHIIHIEKRHVDDRLELCYLVEGYISLESYLATGIKANNVLKILEIISRVINSSKNYFLYSHCFLLDTRYIFIDPETELIALIYLPIKLLQDINIYLKRFLKQFVRKISLVNNSSDCLHFIKSIEDYQDTEEISLIGIQGLIKDLRVSFNSGIIRQRSANESEKPFHLNIKKNEKQKRNETEKETVYNKEKTNRYSKKSLLLYLILQVLFVMVLSGLLQRTKSLEYPLSVFGLIIALLTIGNVFLINRMFPKNSRRETDHSNILKREAWKNYINIKQARENSILKQEIYRK